MHHGQEIFVFFNNFGFKGIIGIVITSIIISSIIYKVFNIILKYNINTYENFVDKTLKVKSKFLKYVINCIINIFLLIIFYIMVAGFGSYFIQEFNVNSIIGALVIILLCYFTFKNGINGIIKVNKMLIPILIILIVYLGIKYINIENIFNYNINKVSNINSNWLISSIIYASYNSIVLIPIMVTLREYIKSKKQILIISLICGFFVMILASLIYFLLNNFKNINEIEIPLVYIARNLGNIFIYIYGVVILAAIYTSAISSGYGFIENITKTKKQKDITIILICLSAIFVSNLGFSNLINILYPIFGYLGILQIFFVILT